MDSDCENIFKVNRVFSEKHVPFAVEIKNGKIDSYSLHHWWQKRCIPNSRKAIRNARNDIGLSMSSVHRFLIQSFGLSLADGYWVCPKEKYLSWNSLNFFENSFSPDFGDLIKNDFMPFKNVSKKYSEIKRKYIYSKHELIENQENVRELDFMSPDITTDGWLKKRWTIDGKKRFLQKWGSDGCWQEPYNEVVATKIMERLGINHVKYDLLFDDKKFPYNLCENFISVNTELIPAGHVYNKFEKSDDMSKYNHMINCYEKLGIQNARQSLDQMIVVDYLISNFDRHYGNFGIIRDSNNLNILGVAPFFDSGTSFWMHNPVGNSYDKNSKTFAKTHDEQIQLIEDFDWLDLDLLDGITTEIEEIFNISNNYDIVRKKDFLIASFKIKLENLNNIVAKL